MSRLTDTQLVILSAASQRDDRGFELPANVKCEAPGRLPISSSAPACVHSGGARSGPAARAVVA
jgi:hypothetical protein